MALRTSRLAAALLLGLTLECAPKLPTENGIMLKRLFSSQLRRNMFSGTATTVINTGVLFLSYPVYLHYLGYEKLGVWMVLSTVLTFVQMCNLGMGPAITKLVAEEHGRGNIDGIQSYVSTAIWTLAAMGIVALTVLLAFRKPIIGLFKLGSENAGIAEQLLPYAGIITVYAFLVQVLTATLSGLGRMDQVNYRDSACRAVSLGVSVLLLSSGYGVVSLLIGTAITFLLMHVTSLFLIKRLVSLRPLAFKWNAERFKCLVSFGGAVLGGSIVNTLLVPLNKLMLSRYAGVSSVPVYEISLNATMQVRGITQAAMSPLTPEVSRTSGAMQATEALTRIRELNRRAVHWITWTLVWPYLALIILAGLILRLWLGNAFRDELPATFRVMLLGVGFLCSFALPGFNTLVGLGRVRHVLAASTVQAGLNVVLVMMVLMTGLPRTAFSFAVITALSMMAGAGYVFVATSRLLASD